MYTQSVAPIDRPIGGRVPGAVLVVVQRHVLALLCGIGRIRLERERSRAAAAGDRTGLPTLDSDGRVRGSLDMWRLSGTAGAGRWRPSARR